MSELIKKQDETKSLRWQLLATTSAIVLCAAVGTAQADDSDHPTVWLELGGQLSHLDDGQEIFAPRFPNSPSRPAMFSSSDGYQGLPSQSVDETGKLSFEPKGTDWVFSASVRYGRSKSGKDVHQQSYPKSFVTKLFFSGYDHTYSFPAHAAKFADTTVNSNETHIVLDFQAGKDIGLGLFGGKDASSIVSVGVRFAQFTTRSNIALKSDPDWHRLYKYLSYPSAGVTHQKWAGAQPYHSNAASLYAVRSFHGVGPSISWNASAPVLGNTKNGELSIDWGVNAALLFGRQKAKVHHQTTGRYSVGTNYNHAARPITFQGPATPNHSRSRMVTVPNVGGFAGATYRIENFKVSAGYRADFFLGAVDNGVDARDSEMIGFHGPFATISVGLGE